MTNRTARRPWLNHGVPAGVSSLLGLAAGWLTNVATSGSSWPVAVGLGVVAAGTVCWEAWWASRHASEPAKAVTAATRRDAHLPATIDVGQVGHNLVVGDGAVIAGHLHLPPMPQSVRVSRHLAPRPMRIVGRNELLDEVRARMLSVDGVSVVALCGLGGVGKTTVALEYAHQHADDYGLAWYLHGETEAALSDQFQHMAFALGMDAAGDPVDLVHEHLAGRAGDWLLVFDNVPDREALRRWLPPRGRGHVLVTSRDGRWPAVEAAWVGALELAGAVELLTEVSGRDDPPVAAETVTMLGLLPLAVVQAGAYVACSGRSLGAYLELLRGAQGRLLGQFAPGDHPPVTLTVTVTADALARENPGSLTLLRLLAFTAPDAVPHHLLLDSPASLSEEFESQIAEEIGALVGDPVAVDLAVDGLRRYSLISRPDPRISVHRLVQAVVVDHIPAGQRAGWKAATAALIDAAVPIDVSRRESWAACSALMSHALACCNLLGMPMWRLAQALGASGNHGTARTVWATLVDAHSAALGADDPATLAARHNFARWTGQAGDATAARDLYASLLPSRARVSGIGHRETLAALHELARWTGRAGDATTARDLYAALLPLRARVSGPEHPETLANRASLARWTGYAGDPDAARDLYAGVLPQFERVSGPEHPDALAARANLAEWTGQAGDPVAAREQFAALLPRREKASGPEHPDTLATLQCLAEWTGQAGDAATARDRYTALLPLWEKVSGPEHPDTLTTRGNLATWTGQAGNAEAARDQFTALLPVRERVSGPEHPDTLTTRGNLARWTGQAGNAGAARDQFASLLPLRRKVSGPEHPHTLTSLHSLAVWTGLAGDPVAARDQLAALLPLREKSSGSEHSDTVSARSDLGYWTQQARTMATRPSG